MAPLKTLGFRPPPISLKKIPPECNQKGIAPCTGQKTRMPEESSDFSAEPTQSRHIEGGAAGGGGRRPRGRCVLRFASCVSRFAFRAFGFLSLPFAFGVLRVAFPALRIPLFFRCFAFRASRFAFRTEFLKRTSNQCGFRVLRGTRGFFAAGESKRKRALSVTTLRYVSESGQGGAPPVRCPILVLPKSKFY